MKIEDYHGIIYKADPIEQFQDWFQSASDLEPDDPEAMSLATVSADGMPNVRMVLCKTFDARGLRFFTNMKSNKGLELAANPNAACCFHWKSLRRQVRVQGTVTKLPDADNDAYFRERQRETQLGAWASQQSRPLETMMRLIQDVYVAQRQYESKPVPRPKYWGGYLITPQTIEFWSERPHRLHERVLYTRSKSGWTQQRLYP